MKVLFAVSNDNITTSVVSKYQQKYKEIITSKNVYYFNAIIKELQRDKTYDAVVIGEDLEPISNNNYDAVDKFIFEKLDNISDEASKPTGEDIPIILICSDRRTKSDQLLIKLFGIGVYNALLGNDRSIDMVCNLIAKPRNKKEAKNYYKIESNEVDYKPESEGDVSESEIQSILAHYKKIGNNDKKCVESFASIAEQYTDAQLRLIVTFLPMSVKAILEANSPKYQQLMTGGTVLSNGNYVQYQQNNPKKPGNIDVLTRDLEKPKLNEPVIIPSTMKVKSDNIQMQNSSNYNMQSQQNSNNYNMQSQNVMQNNSNNYNMQAQQNANNYNMQAQQNANNYNMQAQQNVNNYNMQSQNTNNYNAQVQNSDVPVGFGHHSDIDPFAAYSNFNASHIVENKVEKPKVEVEPQRTHFASIDDYVKENNLNVDLENNDNQNTKENNTTLNTTNTIQNTNINTNGNANANVDANNTNSTLTNNVNATFNIEELATPVNSNNIEAEQINNDAKNMQEFEKATNNENTLKEDSNAQPIEEVKRRGRPRKIENITTNTIENTNIDNTPKRRGRPKKIVADESLMPVANDITNILPSKENNLTNNTSSTIENKSDASNVLPGIEDDNTANNVLPGIEDNNTNETWPKAEQSYNPYDTKTTNMTNINAEDSQHLYNQYNQNTQTMDNLYNQNQGNISNPYNQNNITPYGQPISNNLYDQVPNQNINNNLYGQVPNQNVNNNLYDQVPNQNINNNLYDQVPNQNVNNNLYAQVPNQNVNNNLYAQVQNQNANNNLYDQVPSQNVNNNLYDQVPSQNVNNNLYAQTQNQNNIYGQNANNNMTNNFNNVTNHTDLDELLNTSNNSPITNNSITGMGKIVTFIGTSKNGTSFIVNNLAQLLSQSNINVAILDATKNKNAYYMFTDNNPELVKIATDSIKELSQGQNKGLKVNDKLTVFTSLPDEIENNENPKVMLKTLSNNYDVTLIDCDFKSDLSYFTDVNEIYLVQTMDALTIQPLTQFLNDLKNKNILDENKLRIIVNKYVKLKMLNDKMIIAGMSRYNEPSMTLQKDLFNRDTIKYIDIPFEEQTYAKYLEAIALCQISLNGYSQSFISSLEQLKNMVYPLVSGGYSSNNTTTTYNNYEKSAKKHSIFGLKKAKKQESTQFSGNVNDTLNKMRNNF